VKLNIPDRRTAFGAGHVSCLTRPTVAIRASVGAIREVIILRIDLLAFE